MSNADIIERTLATPTRAGGFAVSPPRSGPGTTRAISSNRSYQGLLLRPSRNALTGCPSWKPTGATRCPSGGLPR